MVDGFGVYTAIVAAKHAFACRLVQHPTAVGGRWRHEVRLLDTLVAKTVGTDGCAEHIGCPRRLDATTGTVGPSAYHTFLRYSRAIAVSVVSVPFARRNPVIRC